ncbi:LCP family protein [Synechococcus sp. CBW1004]|uniref:LCP family protein n=1 Tax=Synechococcus sp. CBW1004 TaxID=1353136 RepID=UPI001E629176|nr:LCP family protein [Synechococcus sp. CBW1004]
MRPRSRQPFSAAVGLAMLVGLGTGLVLARPLAGLLSEPEGKDQFSLSNPFSAWGQGIGRQNLLVLGTDVGGGNTDVIAVVHVADGVTKVTQIPRDTYVEDPRFGPVKINALYSLGGVDTIKAELSTQLNRSIKHHLVVNLASIRRMADQLGGIEVDVPKRMFYVDRSQGLSIDLQPGVQTLRGRDLEGFLRFRHDETGDLGRMERQQLALKSLFRKLSEPQNLVRLPALLLANGKDIQTDLGPMELGGLITSMGGTTLKAQRLDGRPFDQGGVSYWDADWASADEPRGNEAAEESSAASPPGGSGDGERPHRFLF